MDTDKERIEKSVAKYQIAINKNTSESEILWSRYNALLVFNSILIADIGFTYKDPFPSIVITFLPIAGLISCYLWFTMTLRGFQWIDHWIDSAREIEEEHLLEGADSKKVSQLDPIAKGNEKKNKIVGWPRTAGASYVLILMIAILYVIFLISRFCQL